MLSHYSIPLPEIAPQEVLVSVVETAFGWMGAGFTCQGLYKTVFMYDSMDEAEGAMTQSLATAGMHRAIWPVAMESVVDRITRWCDLLQRYFAGEPVELGEIPVDGTAWTAFAAEVYQHLRSTQRGEVVTYGEIAKAIGRPKAARAIGRALAANLVAPVIPCHRVLAANHQLGGYSAGGGQEMKQRLLALEGFEIEVPMSGVSG